MVYEVVGSISNDDFQFQSNNKGQMILENELVTYF